MNDDVRRLEAPPLRAAVESLLAAYGLRIAWHPAGAAIPGSYWGEPEAGLVADVVHARADTPLHSLLHEACHAICMEPARRAALDTDAGGDFAEEDAVCLLQILLAEQLPGVGRERMLADMDRWGYTFRLGSAAAWFEHDAAEPRAWLRRRGLIDRAGGPAGRLRA